MFFAKKAKSEGTQKVFWNRKRKRYAISYLMISPQIIGLFVFTAFPILWAMHKAFFYYTGVESQSVYVGFDNFITAFTQDATYWKTWVTTFKFMFYKLPIELPLALLCAVLLNQKLKGRGFYRSMFFMPTIISVVIVGFMFSNLFDYFGFINALLMKIGIISQEIDWFANTSTAMFALVLGSVWSTFGTNVLYFMAAMANISEDVYEAAKIDGASSVVIFFKITLPLMAPVLATILLLSINGTLHTSEYILLTTNGAPAGSTYTVGAYMIGKFLPGFAGTVVNIGYGCALSLISSVIYSLIAVLYTRASSKLQNLY